jgi:ribosome-associated heat shock protein Hsp15
MTTLNERVRIDKWLWAVRLYKTRSLAVQACKAGHVKVDGHNVKPARFIHIGEIVQARCGFVKRKVKVLELLERRVSAKEVSDYLEDLTPPEDLRPKTNPKVLQPVILHKRGAGRPTKRDRRKLDELEWG